MVTGKIDYPDNQEGDNSITLFSNDKCAVADNEQRDTAMWRPNLEDEIQGRVQLTQVEFQKPQQQRPYSSTPYGGRKLSRST